MTALALAFLLGVSVGLSAHWLLSRLPRSYDARHVPLGLYSARRAGWSPERDPSGPDAVRRSQVALDYHGERGRERVVRMLRRGA